MVKVRASSIHYGSIASYRFFFLKAWLADEVKPISQEFEICDVDDSVTGQMQLEEKGEKDDEKLVSEGRSYYEDEEVVRKEKKKMAEKLSE